MTAAELTNTFLAHADPDKAAQFLRFFKTGKGQYGHGDRFLGISVPLARSLTKPYADTLGLSDCELLLDAPWHEIRLAALLLMAESAKRLLKRKDRRGLQELVACYDRRLERANNWDLVDISVKEIMGAYWQCAETPADERRRFLKKWADSGNLWRERAAIVSTHALQRLGSLDETFWLAAYCINHPHDLIHKASGWMLREAGKRDCDALRAFLSLFCARLPRTTLRYAIERMDSQERRKWMRGAEA